MLLLANALIFFHMARVRSLEIKKGQAAAIAVTLISAGVAIQVGSTVMYGQRARRAIQHLPEAERDLEHKCHYAILAFCVTMCVILGAIALAILRGSLRPLMGLVVGQKHHAASSVPVRK